MKSEILGHYRLRDRLGEGGMGEVWRAEDERTGALVALKIVHATLMSNPEVAQRARTELRALLALRGHPHVLTVLDFIEDPFAIVTEYLEGTSLAEVLATTPQLPLPWVVSHFRDVVRAVAFAHARGILHRDLKPANVMLVDLGTEQAVKVLDFGLARLAQDRKLTQTGQRMGTPDYMAPEQHLGQPVDERTDIYALGVLFYALLAGRPPFTGERFASDYAIMEAHIRQSLPSVRALRPDLPAWVDEVIARATAKNPADRPASCIALLGLLQDPHALAPMSPTPAGLPVLPPAPVAAPKPVAPAPRRVDPAPTVTAFSEVEPDPPVRDRLAPTALLVVAGVVGAVGLGWWFLRDSPPPQAGGGVVAAPSAPSTEAPATEAPTEVAAPATQAPATQPAPATQAPAGPPPCPCKATPLYRVAQSCAEPARSRKWQENDKLGGQWALKARELTATDPEGARKWARDAVEALSCALEAQPDNLRIRGDLGLAFLGAGDREGLRAVHSELEARGAQPNTLAASHFLLADAACAEGNPTQALMHLDQSLELKSVGTGVAMRQARRELIASACQTLPKGIGFLRRENPAVKAANEMVTAVCACQDLACAQKVSTEQAEKLMKFKDRRGTEAEIQAIKAAGKRTADCMKRIATQAIQVRTP